MEYVQRLTSGQRGICRDADGHVAASLWRCATRFGARALGVNAGTISAGRWADLIAVDLSHPLLRDIPPDGLLDAIVFGGDGNLVRRVCVGGRWVV